MEYRTCTYIRDDGNICNSAAVTDRNLCLYHLEHRARLMRMAQYRARGQRFYLQLPPLESMHAVQSALTQLSEALAADMIELKRADRLIRVLNIASRNLLKADKWPASPYHSDQPAPAVDLAASYGLPADLDLDTPPECAFPPNDLDVSPQAQRTEAEDAAFSDSRGLTADGLDFRPDSPVSPEFLELRDITTTQGADAANVRFRQLQRNRARRELRNDRKRYADLALRLNLKKAAERLAEQKVAEKLAEAGIAPAPATAEPFDFDSQVAASLKKSAASFAEIDACLATKEVKTA